MPTQAVRSEVKFKVGRNALLLREFTIAQLVGATGLNPESVRTEVQRLRQEGMVTSERKPGRREALYRLSDDPEKRLALSQRTQAFYPEPPRPVLPRPTSRLYQAARRTLDQAEREEGRPNSTLLQDAAHQLAGAWHAERAGRAPELVRAHLLREMGRLAYLQGKQEEALELLNQAREAFVADGWENEVLLIDHYLLCIEAQKRIDASGAEHPKERLRLVLETLDAKKDISASPLVRLLEREAHPLCYKTEREKVQPTVEEGVQFGPLPRKRPATGEPLYAGTLAGQQAPTEWAYAEHGSTLRSAFGDQDASRTPWVPPAGKCHSSTVAGRFP